MSTEIAVDTSALMTIIANEPAERACSEAAASATAIFMSAGTLAECQIVAGSRHLGEAMNAIVARLNIQIVPVTAHTARAVGEAYARWGKGIHPAKLNFGDCFAYAVAMERGLPLLYVGEDFAQTDVRSALASP